jgi:hypothetical protein
LIMDLPGPHPIGTVTVRGIPALGPSIVTAATNSLLHRSMTTHHSAQALCHLVLAHAEVLGHDPADYAEWLAATLDNWATEARRAQLRGHGDEPPPAEAAE